MKNRRFLLSVLFSGITALALFACSNQTQQAAPKLAEQGGVFTLFNGENLSGWRQQGDVQWLVKNGEITTNEAGEKGYLITDKAYRDFELSLEFWPDAEVNSGVFIRCGSVDRLSADGCFELNIWDQHPNQKNRTGAIVKLATPLAKVETLNQWNQYLIIAQGDRIQAKINGVLVADYQIKDNIRAKRGYVALQRFKQGMIKFRNIKLKPLTP